MIYLKMPLPILWLCISTIAFLASGTALARTVYMAPGGNDSNDGLTRHTPIATIARAHEVISKIAQDAPEDFLVSIAAGVYVPQTVVWRYTMPKHRIRFVGAPDHRSVFDGGRKGLTFFFLRSDAGQPTNLSFEGLKITRYVSAISIHGDREDFSRFNSSNTISNNHFIDVGGTGFDPMGYSTAVVRLVNSDNNTIRGNLFRGMLSTRCEHLHAIYMAHGSSNNIIENNIFENGCGDAIRARDASNNNLIRSNSFVDVGVRAALSEWFCSGRSDCTKRNVECPSVNNRFEENTVRSGYQGKVIESFFAHKRPISPICR